MSRAFDVCISVLFLPLLLYLYATSDTDTRNGLLLSIVFVAVGWCAWKVAEQAACVGRIRRR